MMLIDKEMLEAEMEEPPGLCEKQAFSATTEQQPQRL